MAKIIELFKKKEPPTQDKPQALVDYDFRGEWDRAVVKLQAEKIPKDYILEHEVSVHDICRGICVAILLKKDYEAGAVLMNRLSGMATDVAPPVCLLQQLPAQVRGYVWTLDYRIIINAGVFSDAKLASIIGRPLTRRSFFGELNEPT